jgi:hypothetical protein
VIHHRADVIHPGLKGELRFPVNDVIGESGASAVEEDEASEAAETARESGHLRPFPRLFDVEDETRDEHQIGRAFTDGLVGDVDAVRGCCIPRLVYLHRPILGSGSSARKWCQLLDRFGRTSPPVVSISLTSCS